MESVRRRRCETCEFHQPGPSPCTGFCTNREWQSEGGVQRFVRDRELACYCGWGKDYWKPRNGPNPPSNGTSGGPGPIGGGGGGRSPEAGLMSRYGTIAGGRIVQLRLIGATSEPTRLDDAPATLDDEPATPRPALPLSDEWN